MGLKTRRHREHAGAKNSDAKSGYWGKRVEAKSTSNKSRRRQDKPLSWTKDGGWVDVGEYRRLHGKETNALYDATMWLNMNRKQIEKKYSREYAFDYPDYWDMPKSIARRLRSDEIDWIQQETYDWNYEKDR